MHVISTDTHPLHMVPPMFSMMPVDTARFVQRRPHGWISFVLRAGRQCNKRVIADAHATTEEAVAAYRKLEAANAL